jgi:hypothetical protein
MMIPFACTLQNFVVVMQSVPVAQITYTLRVSGTPGDNTTMADSTLGSCTIDTTHKTCNVAVPSGTQSIVANTLVGFHAVATATGTYPFNAAVQCK